jgi:hypothetical protein
LTSEWSYIYDCARNPVKLHERASPIKTIETVLDHPAGSKKQKKSSTNNAVEAKGIADGTHQSSKVDGKAIAFKSTEGTALSSAKRASAIKTSKKQKKSLTNDAVEAKGIGDSSSVLTTSTKSKNGITAPKGPHLSCFIQAKQSIKQLHQRSMLKRIMMSAKMTPIALSMYLVRIIVLFLC